MIEGMRNTSKNLRIALPLVLTAGLLAGLLVPPAPARAQERPAPIAAAAPQADQYALDQKIPVDPRITVGQLSNGLRYWIRENREPKNRAELRLVVNAGSVLEDEDQRGLAHVVEHLAFNGSTHFPKQKLVDFMESIGMRFGPDLNAFTSFDETIYMLKVPTDSPAILETAFLILEDWAHNLTFDPKAIDKERGIIVEEWRLGQGAEARMRDKQFPILLQRLALRRAPARRQEGGHRELRLRHPEALLPDLVPPRSHGRHRRRRFRPGPHRGPHQEAFRGPSPMPPGAVPRPTYPVPDHDGTLFAIAADKEASQSIVAVYHKLPAADQSTVGSYRRMLVERLFNDMLNDRLDRDRPEARPALPRRRLEPGPLRRLEGRLRPVGPRRRRRHPARAPGHLHGRGARGPLRLHRDRARAPQERRPCATSSAPWPKRRPRTPTPTPRSSPGPSSKASRRPASSTNTTCTSSSCPASRSTRSTPWPGSG